MSYGAVTAYTVRAGWTRTIGDEGDLAHVWNNKYRVHISERATERETNADEVSSKLVTLNIRTRKLDREVKNDRVNELITRYAPAEEKPMYKLRSRLFGSLLAKQQLKHTRILELFSKPSNTTKQNIYRTYFSYVFRFSYRLCS